MKSTIESFAKDSGDKYAAKIKAAIHAHYRKIGAMGGKAGVGQCKVRATARKASLIRWEKARAAKRDNTLACPICGTGLVKQTSTTGRECLDCGHLWKQ